MANPIPNPPGPLDEPGRSLWNAALTEHNLPCFGREVLYSACLTIDRREQLRAQLASVDRLPRERQSSASVALHNALTATSTLLARLLRELAAQTKQPEAKRPPGRPGQHDNWIWNPEKRIYVSLDGRTK